MPVSVFDVHPEVERREHDAAFFRAGLSDIIAALMNTLLVIIHASIAVACYTTEPKQLISKLWSVYLFLQEGPKLIAVFLLVGTLPFHGKEHSQKLKRVEYGVRCHLRLFIFITVKDEGVLLSNARDFRPTGHLWLVTQSTFSSLETPHRNTC